MPHYQSYSFLTHLKTIKPLITYMRHSCQVFEQKHPLFIGALYWLSGLVSRSFPISSLSVIIVLSLFVSQNKMKKQIFLYCLWISAAIVFPYLHPHPGEACGKFVINTAPYKTRNYYVYQTTPSLIMSCCGQKYFPTSCRIQSTIPLMPNKQYFAQGHLSQNNALLTFTLTHVEQTNLSYFRSHKYTIRCYLQQLIASRFPNAEHAAFASSLLLGTSLPDPLRSLFRQKGLSHMFVVSGWHFSLFFLFFSYLLRPIPNRHKPYAMLISFALLAYIFPWSPSVCRVWVSYSLHCCSLLVDGQASSLNRLGLSAIICSIFFSPMSPSFALSFLSTLGILLFYSPLLHCFISPWKHVLSTSWIKIVHFLTSSFVLSLSAQLFIYIPSLTFFKIFHLDGLLLNIFFPLLITPLFFMIVLSLFIPILSTLTQMGIHYVLALPFLHTNNILISLQPTAQKFLNFTSYSLILFLLGVFMQQKHPLNSEHNDLTNIL